jgi:hypothetical protein
MKSDKASVGADPAGDEGPAGCILAVDLGLRTGLALFGHGGRLLWYRSKHFKDMAGLRRRVCSLLGEIADLELIVIEGGGPLSDLWEKEAGRRGIALRRVDAGEWRSALFYPRQYSNGVKAKRAATALARRVIEWSGAPRPKALRHHAAEAILIGYWTIPQLGILKNPLK